MLACYTEKDLQVFKYMEIAEYLLDLGRCFKLFCHQAHRSGVGHVTTKINIQGARAYRSSTGYSCPLRFFKFCCHQFLPVRYRSCDNISAYTGYQILPVRYWLQLPLHIYPLFGHQFLPVRYRSCDNISAYTGYQILPVRYWLQLPLHIYPLFGHQFHRSGTGHVTTHTQGPSAYRSGTGYSCPHRFSRYIATSSYRSGTGHLTTYQHTRGARPYWLPLPCHRKKFLYFVTNSHRYGTGHVTTLKNTGYHSCHVTDNYFSIY